MTIYDDMQKVAQSLLGSPEFSQGVMHLVQVTAGAGTAYNPGASTETLHNVDGVARGAKFKYIQKNLAVASDFQVTFAPNGYEPQATDFFEIDGQRFKIVYIDRKPSAGTAVAFTLIIRR